MTRKRCGCRGLKQDEHPECDACILKRFGYLCCPGDTCSFCINTTHKDWVIILAARRKRDAKNSAKAEVATAKVNLPPAPHGNCDSSDESDSQTDDWSSDSSFNNTTESLTPTTSQSDSSSSSHSVYNNMVKTQSMLETTTSEPRTKHAKLDAPPATESRPQAKATYEPARDRQLYEQSYREAQWPYPGMAGQNRPREPRRIIREFDDSGSVQAYKAQSQHMLQPVVRLGKRVNPEDYGANADARRRICNEIGDDFQRQNFSPQFRQSQVDTLAQIYNDSHYRKLKLENKTQPNPNFVRPKAKRVVTLQVDRNLQRVGQTPMRAHRSRSPQRAPLKQARQRLPSLLRDQLQQRPRSPQRRPSPYRARQQALTPQQQQQRARSRSPLLTALRVQSPPRVRRVQEWAPVSLSPQYRVEQRTMGYRRNSPPLQSRHHQPPNIRFADGLTEQTRTPVLSPVRSPHPHPAVDDQVKTDADDDGDNEEAEDDEANEQISFQTLLKIVAHCAPEAKLLEFYEQNFKASVVLQSGHKLDTRKFYGLSTASSITLAVKGFQKLFYDKDIDKPLKYLNLFHCKGGRPNMKPYKSGDDVIPAEGLKPPSSRFAWANQTGAHISLAVTDVTYLEEVAREGLRILSFLELLNQALKAAFTDNLPMSVVKALHTSSIQANKDLLLVNTIFAGSMVQLKRDNFLLTVTGLDAKQKETLRHAPWDCSTELFSSAIMNTINLEHVAYLQTHNMPIPATQRPPNKAKHMTSAQRGNKG